MRWRGLGNVLYTWLVIGAAGYVLVDLFPDLNFDVSQELLIMITLIVLAEWFAVTFPQGVVSGGFAVIFATFLIYGGAAAVYVVGIAILIGQGIANRGNPLRTTLFNVAQYVLAVYGAIHLYNFAGGAVLGRLTIENLLPLVVFVISYYMINHLLVSLHQAPRRDIYPTLSRLDILKWDAYTYLFAIPAGLLMVLLYNQLGIIGSVLIFALVIAAQFMLRMYVNLELANRELTALYQVSSRLAISDLDELMNLILKELLRICDYHTGIFYLWRHEKGYFEPVVIKSHFEQHLLKDPVYPGEGFAGLATESRQPVIVKDVQAEPQLKNQPGLPQWMRSLTAVPLVSSQGVVGVIVLGSKFPRSFDRGHLHAFSIMAGQAAVAVTNAMLSDRLRLFFDSQD